MVVLFTIQVPDGDDPTGVRVDAERQQRLVSLLTRHDLVRDESVFSVVGVVSLHANDAVPDGHVLHDRLLEERRVESGRVVVDVAHVHQQLRRVGAARIAAVLRPHHQPVAPHRLKVQLLDDGHVATQRVDDKVALCVATDERVAQYGIGASISISRPNRTKRT